MGGENITILCYADNTVLIADSEENLEKSLQSFSKAAMTLKILISTEKIKSLVVSKNPIRRALVVDDRVREKVMKIKYIDVEVQAMETTIRKSGNR